MINDGDLASSETGATLLPWMNLLIRYVQSNQPDLTNRQLALLLIVYLLPGPHTVRGLAARLHVSKPVITRALNSLSALGYLRRQRDETDLRNVLVEQTANGNEFLKAFAELIEKANDGAPTDQRKAAGGQ
jgi:DNA-binding MarR family transcriptional regulator